MADECEYYELVNAYEEQGIEIARLHEQVAALRDVATTAARLFNYNTNENAALYRIACRKLAAIDCECEGECGHDHGGRCAAVHNKPHPVTGSNVILTTAHLGTPHADGTPGDKHDKMDVRPENLKAMCQRCHLCYDIEEHKHNAAMTRLQKKIATGQKAFEWVTG